MLVTRTSLLLVSLERMGVAQPYVLSPQEAVAEFVCWDCQESKASLGYTARLSKRPKKGKGGGVRETLAPALMQGQAWVPSLQGKLHCSWHQRSLMQKTQ